MIAIIPARGGSKRIPRKNIKEFCGLPIIAYSIKTALESGLFERVIVSTDDIEIAEVAKAYGAEVPFIRSYKNSDDFSGTFEVLEEVLEKAQDHYGKYFDSGCCIYPTAPLLTCERLVEGHNLFSQSGADTVFPVLKYSYPVQRSLISDSSGKVVMQYPENYHSRSQDLEPVFHDAGQFYFFNTSKLLQSRKLFTDASYAIFLDEMEVQDIDNETDWKLAELKMQLR